MIFSSTGFAQRAAILPGIHAAATAATPAAISGTVTDTTGAIVPGAHVALTTAAFRGWDLWLRPLVVGVKRF